jgi:hypothetical protein
MGGNDLSSHRELYLEGPDATNLNTVDIWCSKPDSASPDDERLWVMLVCPVLSSQQIMLTAIDTFMEEPGETHRWTRGALSQLSRFFAILH